MSDEPQTYDFCGGPVPAHRHVNPDGTQGGWVTYSASVPASCHIDATATVGSNCTLGSDCTLGSNCRLGSYCRLGSNCTLGSYCRLGSGTTTRGRHNHSPLYLQGSRYWISFVEPGIVRSGCIEQPIEWWLEHVERCAAEHDYTGEQQVEYRLLIELMAAWMRHYGVFEPVTKTEAAKKEN